MNPLSPLGQKGIAPIAIALILLAIAGGVILFSNRAPNIPPPLILVYDYDSCVNAGYPITKNIPPSCLTPDGRIFEKGKGPTAITNYQQCVAAGYPIMESYPEQCKTPDGKTFTRNISSGCVNDSTCTQGYFCKLGLCTEFSPEISCDTDADCTLIDVVYRFACCGSNYCDGIDYSNSRWEAANLNWFTENRTNYCPDEETCGPTVACATPAPKLTHTAKCINRLCEKKFVPEEDVAFYCETTLSYEPPGPELTAYEQYHGECGAYSAQTACENANVSTGCQWVARSS